MKFISADYIKAWMKNDRLMQGNAEYELWKQEVDKQVDAMPSIEVMDVVTAYQQGWCDALDASISALNDAKFQLGKEADRKIEPQTCNDCIWSVCNYNKVFGFFRNPTAEERKAVADYIDSISVPTGVNVFDFMDEPQTTSTPHKVDTSSVCKTEPSNSEKPNNSKERSSE